MDEDEQKQIERKQLIRDYQITFDSDSGSRVYADLARRCRFNQIIDCDDSMILSQATGSRNVFVYIKRMKETDLDKEIQTEAKTDEE